MRASTGQFAYEPVWRWSRSSLVPSPSSAQIVLPRGLSIRVTARPTGAVAGRTGARSDGRRQEALKQRERLSKLELALFEAGAHVAARSLADGRLEAVVGQPAFLAGARVVRDSRAARGRADSSEKDGLGAAEYADVDQPVLERGVEGEVAPSGLRVALQTVEHVARGAAFASRNVEIAASTRTLSKRRR